MPEAPQHQKLILPGTDQVYEFDADRYLTRSALSHIKQWFGAEIGAGTMIKARLAVGDPDASAAAMWLIRKAEAIAPNPEPQSNAVDFPIGKHVIAPNRREEMPAPVWTFQIEDEDPLLLDMDEMVGVKDLRRIAKRYPDLSSFSDLYLGFIREDPDAVACGIWFARSALVKQGKWTGPNPLPWDMEDFSVSRTADVENNITRDEDGEPIIPKVEEDPTTGTTVPEATAPQDVPTSETGS